MGCDTLVALAPATRDGITLFAKNSDRDPGECQRVVQTAAARHEPGALLRCQYVEIPQVAATAAVLGSQPHWLWGFEHGVNEHGVAIGNQTVFSREPVAESGLLGMDLVRLGLERARTADEALEVVTTLVAEHGQGGSGHPTIHWPYHSGFVIADPHGAWLLETSDRRWVARRVRDVDNASNCISIGSDWDRASDDVARVAAAQGWWDERRGRLDFHAAYADDRTPPQNLAAGRRRRAATLLEEGRGELDVAHLRALLRDHHPGAARVQRPFEHPDHFTLCMHTDVSATTASMVAPLVGDASAPHATWVALGAPCIAPYLPCYPELGVAPARLGLGEASADPESPWWRAHELLALVDRDPARVAPAVRARWEAFEAGVDVEAAGVERRAADALRAGDRRAAEDGLGRFVERVVDDWLVALDALMVELAPR
jgi:dipeptidase